MADPQVAARLAWRVGADLLEGGASAAGPIVQADLRRAVHAARTDGLHRLVRAGVRVGASVRALHAARPEFHLADLATALDEWMRVARALGGGAAPAAEDATPWIGTGRRSYPTIGTLRLTGLLCEPVASGTGYAGVTSWLADEQGRIWTLSDILPATVDRAWDAYAAPVRTGGLRLQHRSLCREAIVLEHATGSDDGRLGSGAAVSGERHGPTPWPDSLWSAPIPEQIDRGDLLFVRIVTLGADREALVAALPDGSPVRCPPATEHEELAWRENLALLARAPGLPLRAIGRRVAGPVRTLALLAVGPDEGEADGPSLQLPDAWNGRCNLGLDLLHDEMVRGIEATVMPAAVPPPPPDPLEPLRRRLERMALGGRSTLPPPALVDVAREAAALEAAMMPGAAAALRRLAHAATSPRDGLAEVWLAGSVYEAAARRRLWRDVWA